MHTGICVAIAAFGIAFTLPLLVRMPLLWYHPTEHAWAFETTPTVVAMDWFGRVGMAILAGLIGYVLGRVLPMRWSRTRRAAWGWATLAGAIVLVSMTIYAVRLAQREPKPLAPTPVNADSP